MTQDQNADSTISRLESRAETLQKSGLLSSIRDSLEDLDTQINQMPSQLTELRTKGYVFKRYLEEKAQALKTDWPTLRQQVQREIDARSRDLESDLHRVESTVRSLAMYKGKALTSAQSAINRAESELDSAERRVKAANDTASGMFDRKKSDAYQINREIEQCLEWLGWVDKASFGFQPGEALVEAVKGQWLQDGNKEGPKGILFLTDRRIVFEQREKVAKKKVLFITTASEEVQEVQWEAPLGAIVEAQASEQRKALIMKKEHLTLKFKPPATIREVLVELSGGDSDEWRALINRMLSGDVEKERIAGAAQAAAVEAAIEVPSKCPSCGASLDIQVVKGMSALKCPFCGTNVPLTKNA
ncbi:MAG: hypothetical protein JW934_00080 [Anaerolineae bacterium]|nr:hypothetical protein [Anaerolineae bacterium]